MYAPCWIKDKVNQTSFPVRGPTFSRSSPVNMHNNGDFLKIIIHYYSLLWILFLLYGVLSTSWLTSCYHNSSKGHLVDFESRWRTTSGCLSTVWWRTRPWTLRPRRPWPWDRFCSTCSLSDKLTTGIGEAHNVTQLYLYRPSTHQTHCEYSS